MVVMFDLVLLMTFLVALGTQISPSVRELVQMSGVLGVVGTVVNWRAHTPLRIEYLYYLCWVAGLEFAKSFKFLKRNQVSEFYVRSFNFKCWQAIEKKIPFELCKLNKTHLSGGFSPRQLVVTWAYFLLLEVWQVGGVGSALFGLRGLQILFSRDLSKTEVCTVLFHAALVHTILRLSSYRTT